MIDQRSYVAFSKSLTFLLTTAEDYFNEVFFATFRSIICKICRYLHLAGEIISFITPRSLPNKPNAIKIRFAIILRDE